jgi:hypothetical protein
MFRYVSIMVLMVAAVLAAHKVAQAGQGSDSKQSPAATPAKSAKPKQTPTSMPLGRDYREAAMLARVSIRQTYDVVIDDSPEYAHHLDEVERAKTIATARATTTGDHRIEALLSDLLSMVQDQRIYHLRLKSISTNESKDEFSALTMARKRTETKYLECDPFVEKMLIAGKYQGTGPCKTDRQSDETSKPSAR